MGQSVIDVGVVHLAGQAVGAEENDVTLLEGSKKQVHFDRWPDAQCQGDNSAAWFGVDRVGRGGAGCTATTPAP